ncbi:thioredoxin domain-containing protein [Dactylosporangium vinaceum]|uniref:DsbA family protein n=1 Tax=Dactylosporangium vinaceum TaxID=53362 RepID=A0ABV5MQE7_9ACTN|nr:thioredoxin domain-containing protein [Dactylosporangium vinaceum]UAB96499.1 thioredoxin domain-containing protein [Dactylosporangium vinaceum]
MTTTPFQVSVPRLTVPVGPDDHTLGPAGAPVSLVEYGDFQCPYCAMSHVILRDLLRLRGELIRYTYRHFPLTNVHPYADLAAEVAEAAAERNAFWPMRDWLFANREGINPRRLMVGVERLGLPSSEIGDEVGAHLYLDRVRRDLVGGVRSGVGGTPTFFVNGVRHDGGYALADLLEAVDEAAEAAVPPVSGNSGQSIR